MGLNKQQDEKKDENCQVVALVKYLKKDLKKELEDLKKFRKWPRKNVVHEAIQKAPNLYKSTTCRVKNTRLNKIINTDIANMGVDTTAGYIYESLK